MTKQRTWRNKKQGPGQISALPPKPPTRPPLVVQPLTLLRPTAGHGLLATPQAPSLTTTVLTPSCIYSATWGLTNRGVSLVVTESSSWGSRRSEPRNSGGLNTKRRRQRTHKAEEHGVPFSFSFLFIFFFPSPFIFFFGNCTRYKRRHLASWGKKAGGGRAAHSC